MARGPLGLVSISNETRSPPTRRSKSRGAWRPPRWKKYSFPSSAAMKPKPRSATTFLIVPVVMSDPCILFPNRWQTHGPFEKGDHAERRSKLQQRTHSTRFRLIAQRLARLATGLRARRGGSKPRRLAPFGGAGEASDGDAGPAGGLTKLRC